MQFDHALLTRIGINMLDPTRPMLSRVSHYSLYLELLAHGNRLADATGFVAVRQGRYFLVTNWHVLAGRHAETGICLREDAAVPLELRIRHHGWTGDEHIRVEVMEPLYEADDFTRPRWITHAQGRNVDLAALPIDLHNEIAAVPLDLDGDPSDLIPLPGLPVAIVGYPYGMGNDVWPIWKTGHIASDPNLGFNGAPAFLIDATTRPAMSGSPVFFHSPGPFYYREGKPAVNAQVQVEFLGVYAGRIREDVEVGRVWRADALCEMLDAPVARSVQ